MTDGTTGTGPTIFHATIITHHSTPRRRAAGPVRVAMSSRRSRTNLCGADLTAYDLTIKDVVAGQWWPGIDAALCRKCRALLAMAGHQIKEGN